LPAGSCLIITGSGYLKTPEFPPRRCLMLALIGLLLVIWLVCAVVGAVVKGLVWLLVLGAVLFVITAVVGWMKREALRR